jgi:hypothetical protein
MNNWPSIATLPPPSEGVEEDYYKPQLKNEKEGNYIQTRLRATRSRSVFPLKWNYLTEVEYQALKTFFDTNQGLIFVYTHPIEGTTHNCVFSTNSIRGAWLSAGGRANVQCPIEEI